MSILRKLALGVATSALAFAAASEAAAQSTGTQAVEQVVVTARRNQVPTIGGLITRETEPKDRATITNQYLQTQVPGQTIFQSLNLVPGLNFTNNDPYGSSGGNLRIHGFDSNRIGLTWDGMPLNDTGNYAIFTNQQADPEIVDQVQVNLGATDVDSPTAAAVGGLVNYVTRRPASKAGIWLQPSFGDFSFTRMLGLIDTGKFGPFGTSAYVESSFSQNSKFRGSGAIQKTQINGVLEQPLARPGDFIRVAAHYNQNRNNSYRAVTQADVATNGYRYDWNSLYITPSFTNPTAAGVGGIDIDPALNANFYGLRVNPSNTGNIRAQSRFTITDRLRLTVDPFFQYVLANGGGSTTVPENDARLIGNATVFPTCRFGTAAQLRGVDLNGDGDCRDTVRLYSPSNTNTRRYGVTSSLIYDLNPTNRFRIAYTLDTGRHRQTSEYGFIYGGFPESVFGGKDGYASKVATADGSFLRGRDRYSIAELNQFAGEYRGSFFADQLVVLLGLRAPFFSRDLNQYCYSALGNSFPYCTTQTIPATAAYNINNFLNPFKLNFKYDKVLPNVGATLKLGESQSVFASYAQNLAAPRTDNLYTVVRGPGGPDDVQRNTQLQPETSDSYNVGYRFQTPKLLISADGFLNQFQNRIVTSFNQDLGVNIDRNVGNVEVYGVDVGAAWTPIEKLIVSGSFAYNHSELKQNLLLGVVNGVQTVLPLAGKRFPETPEYTFGGRIQYELFGIQFGFQGKYVDDRFATDLNDEVAPSYTTFDADARFSLKSLGYEGVYVQLNVQNLTDENYFGSINSTTNAIAIAATATSNAISGSLPTYQIGAPRTVSVTLGLRF